MKNYRMLSLLISVAFLGNTMVPGYLFAQDVVLPNPGVMLKLSPNLNPPILKGIKVNTDNPFKFDFIVDRGDRKLTQDQLKEESNKMIKYFLASLTIPEKDLWVNLSPYEKNRIVPDTFGRTEMGRDLLAQDYVLKQITASLMYPEDAIGKKFWKRIYQTMANKSGPNDRGHLGEETHKKFGNVTIPINTFNKVWIVPQQAVVYESTKGRSAEGENAVAYVVKSTLKVMLEEDYLATQKNTVGISNVSVRQQELEASEAVRAVILPELQREVNEGANFAHLRQVYNSLILATWYKKKIKDSILSYVYTDKNKVAGVNIDDPAEKQRIYQQYLQAFKKGVYNYIKEEIDPVSHQNIPRKYFSGGMALRPSEAMIVTHSLTGTLKNLISGSVFFLVGAAVVIPTIANAQGSSPLTIDLGLRNSMATITQLPGGSSSGANYSVSNFPDVTFFGDHYTLGEPLVLRSSANNGQHFYLLTKPRENGFSFVRQFSGEGSLRVPAPINQGDGAWVINSSGALYTGRNTTNQNQRPLEFFGSDHSKFLAFYENTPVGTFTTLVPEGASFNRGSGSRVNLSTMYPNGIANFTSPVVIDGNRWRLTDPTTHVSFQGINSGIAPSVYFGNGSDGAYIMTSDLGITFTDNGTRVVVPTSPVNISLRHLDIAPRQTYTFGAFPQPAGSVRNPNLRFIYDREHNAAYLGNLSNNSVITALNGGGLWTVTNVAVGSASGGVGITLTPFNYPNTTFSFGTQTQVRTVGDKTVWTLPSSLGVTFRGKASLTGIPSTIWGPGHKAFHVDSIVGGGATGGATVTVTPIDTSNRRDHSRTGQVHHGRRGGINLTHGHGIGDNDEKARHNKGKRLEKVQPSSTWTPAPIPSRDHSFDHIAVGIQFTWTLSPEGVRFSHWGIWGTNSPAMITPENEISPEGGIDFNSHQLNLQLKNAGKEIKFNTSPAMLAQLRNAPGFTSVVIGIKPMTELNLKQFLGV